MSCYWLNHHQYSLVYKLSGESELSQRQFFYEVFTRFRLRVLSCSQAARLNILAEGTMRGFVRLKTLFSLSRDRMLRPCADADAAGLVACDPEFDSRSGEIWNLISTVLVLFQCVGLENNCCRSTRLPPHIPLRANGLRECAPNDRLREAIRSGAAFSVIAGHSRPKDGVASARLCPGPSTSFLPKYVDARDICAPDFSALSLTFNSEVSRRRSYAGTGAGRAIGTGLNVMAITKAPRPMIQEPM